MLDHVQLSNSRTMEDIGDGMYYVEIKCKKTTYCGIITNTEPEKLQQFVSLYNHQIKELNLDGFFRKIRGSGYVVRFLPAFELEMPCGYCGDCSKVRG